jgi:MinD-like ATPase involved in chromosome partitioning or flagellar assembly
VELPTYTNIWKIEKRLYKLYDFRLPMPLPVGQVAAFLAIAIPYMLILATAGMPFSHTWVWLYVLPPGVLAWLVTRPVLEGKRLPELVVSQLRYLSEPRTWCRMAPLGEKDQMFVTAKVWRRSAVAAQSGLRAADGVQADHSGPVAPDVEIVDAALPEDAGLSAETPVAAEAAMSDGPRHAGAAWPQQADVGGRSGTAAESAYPTRPVWPTQPALASPGAVGEPGRIAYETPVRAATPAPATRVRAVTPLPATPIGAGAMSAPTTPARVPSQEPAARKPRGRQLPAQSAAAQNAAAQSPAVQSPAAQSSAAQSPAAQSPAVQSPAAQSPAAQSPAVQSSAAQSPAGQRPAAQSPAGQRPAAQNAAGQTPPTGVARPHGRPALTVRTGGAPARPLPVVERALRDAPGDRTNGWHEHVVVVPGGHRPGKPDQLQRDQARARMPLPGPARIVILGCTAGAGQTTTTLLTGQLLAALRGQAIAVLDIGSGSGSGSLTEQARQIPRLLPGHRDRSGAASGSGGERGLQVVTADAPADQPADAGKLIDAVVARYQITIADPAAPHVPRAVQAADQLVLVAPASADAAGSLAMTLEWLEAHGHTDVARSAVTVLNGVSVATAEHVDKAAGVATGRCRAIVRVPWDDRLADGGAVGLATVHAFTALAGVLVAGLAKPVGASSRVGTGSA